MSHRAKAQPRGISAAELVESISAEPRAPSAAANALVTDAGQAPPDALLALATPQTALTVATVVSTEGKRALVTTETERFETRRAASCLLAPAAGDRVLVAQAPGGAYLLAVLERDDAEPMRIEARTGLEVHAPAGTVALRAVAVELVGAEHASVSAPKLELAAKEGNVFVERLRMLGAELEARVGTVSLVAEAIDTVAQRLRQQLDRCYRFVDGLEQLRAGTVDYQARGYARIHAEDAIVTADKLVKVDGAQIHMG